LGCRGSYIIADMENPAGRYRNIAAEVRARADNLSDEGARQSMLLAAQVWERLAALADKSMPPHLEGEARRLNA